MSEEEKRDDDQEMQADDGDEQEDKGDNDAEDQEAESEATEDPPDPEESSDEDEAGEGESVDEPEAGEEPEQAEDSAEEPPAEEEAPSEEADEPEDEAAEPAQEPAEEAITEGEEGPDGEAEAEPAEEPEEQAPAEDEEEPSEEAEEEPEGEPAEELEGEAAAEGEEEPGEEAEGEAAEQPVEETEKPPASNKGLIIAIVVVGAAILGILAVLLKKEGEEPDKTEAPPAETVSIPRPQPPEPPKPKQPSKTERATKLVGQLDTDDLEQESKAREALVKLGRAAVKPLANSINAKSLNLRENVVAALGDLKIKEAVAPLSRVLKIDEEAGVRCAAAEALASIGDPSAVEPLIQAVTDKDEDVQNAAIQALEGITRNFDLMSNTESDDPKVLQKLWADWYAKAKGDIGKDRAVAEAKPDVPMHLHMFRAGWHEPIACLHPVTGIPGGGLHGEEGSHKLLAYLEGLPTATLMEVAKDESAWLWKELAVKDTNKLVTRLRNKTDLLSCYVRARLRVDTVTRLDRGGAPTKDDVGLLLGDFQRRLKSDPALRGSAIQRLGESKTAGAASLLAAAAKEDPDKSVRLLAARGLRIMGHADAAPALKALLKDAGLDARVRAAAAHELGLAKANAAVPALVDALGSSDKELQKWVLDALQTIAPNAGVKPASTKPKDVQKAWQAWCAKQQAK